MATKTKSKITSKIPSLKIPLNKIPDFKQFLKKPIGKIILGFIILIALLYYFKGIFITAFVNGRPITRLSVIQELESQGGKQALEALITETLIQQQAQKTGVTISEQELDDEFAALEANLQEQGQNLEQLLTLQGLKKSDIEKQIRIQKLLEKMLSDKLTVTEEEIEEFITENATFLPEDLEIDKQDDYVRNQIKQQKLTGEIQTFLAELREKASVNYLVDY